MEEFYGYLIVGALSLFMGVRFILSPQQNRAELKVFSLDFSGLPPWAIRILGVFVIAVALGVLYLSWISLQSPSPGPSTQQSSKDFEAHYTQAQALAKKGDLGRAIAEYREALRLRPDFAEGHYNLGVTLGDKGDRDGAIASLRKAVALNPKFLEALGNLGVALSSKGELDEAIGVFRETLKLYPDNALIHAGLAVALRRKGDEEAANREFEEARRLDSKLAPLAPRGTLPIVDDFTGECGWPSGEMNEFSYGCAQGAYRMHLKRAGPVHVMRGAGLEAHAVSLEADVAVTSGVGTEPGKAMLGVGCIADGEHGYIALLRTDGTWAIMRFDREFAPLAGSNYPPIPVHGSGARLRVVCDARSEEASVVSFFVDGRRVGSTEIKQGYRWFNGFFLYADTFPGDVVFKRFLASQPKD
jgi:tetratricopeptide (TPR) repeat protein